ncbi:MFS transporter [Micromonospora sp. NPDC049679]|uniref:MFS transporter n=1 Tax=Micromonospora sp. NPDC049679 TaxID=3155920 RepID=UPI0033C48DAE
MTRTVPTQAGPDQKNTASARKVAVASLIGTAIEWYDFYIYGIAAALVLGPQFFPSFSSVGGTLAAFATFAVGFVARPVGGMIAGHLGDKVGRKSMLVATLLAMGAATFCIGLLPTYDTIGVWAPILLVTLRFVQGIAAGGEWGGAALMAVEFAPAGKRGFYGSFPAMGVPAGLVLSNGVFLLLNAFTTEKEFAAWGWRIAFLSSIVLVVVGLFIRLAIGESPEFVKAKQENDQSKFPLGEVVRRSPKQVLLACGAHIGINAMGYLFLVYALSYMTKVVGFTRQQVLIALVCSSLVWLAALAPAGKWSDRVGRRKVFLVGTGAMALWSIAFFPLMDTKSMPLALVALGGMALTLGISYGPQAALFSEMFNTRVRYSGASLGYQLGATFGGGIAPFIATALYSATGGSASVAAYMVVVSLISVVSVAAIAETYRRDLGDVTKG